ncbi:hypothetical protein H4582DRAFT_2062125 [Lactarius indigo]|nr:hypothetical protein H4582DRAFT_2062125 [Lactarius indigo]
MLSFSKIITFAAVAFGTLSQAVPLSPREVNTETCALVPGQLKDYLTDVENQLAIKFQSISSLTNSGAAVSTVSPVLEDVVTYFNVQLVCIKQLAGKPIDEVLKNGDGVLTVGDVWDLVRNILAVVFGALAPVIGHVQDTGLLTTLSIIVDLTFTYVKAVIRITGGFGGLLVEDLRTFVRTAAVSVVLPVLHILSPF